MMRRERLSLKARALAWLAQREHSRAELRRKLLRVARAEQRAREEAKSLAATPEGVVGLHAVDRGGKSAAAPAESSAEPSAGCTDPETCVDRLLDWLQANRYLSEVRFVESRVNARASRYGNLRIRQELAQHGVEVDAETQRQLRETELHRARAVWARKFAAPATEPHEQARQMRFLAQRGFSAEVVRRVVQARDDEGEC